MEFDLSMVATKKRLREFAEEIEKISDRIGFKVSARGWAYQLEQEGLITKAEFDKVESLINRCRKLGILPIDFTAEEEGRRFSGVIIPTEEAPLEELREWIEYIIDCEGWYKPNWWEGEEYYIQMVVEKIDLKTLFEPICKKYHIPIATSKGWSSMLQRAIYSRRFKEAEGKGLQPVLLYCGDHDPDGLRISDFLRKNLDDLKDIVWEDGLSGYNPSNLEIVRFGLDYDFIEKHNLTWINNLITGSKRDLSSPSHKNHNMPYVQEYIKKFGIRKCEANAIVPMPEIARELVENAITEYLGDNALERFEKTRKENKEGIIKTMKEIGVYKKLKESLDLIDKNE